MTTTQDIITNVFDETAVRQYLVHETIGGEIVATIGCITLYGDGTAMITDLNEDGTVRAGQLVRHLTVNKFIAARLFGEDPIFCAVERI